MKVWSIENLGCTHTYRPAHADMILDVAVHPENDNILVSCSEDGEIILWDIRCFKPAFGNQPPPLPNDPLRRPCVARTQRSLVTWWSIPFSRYLWVIY